MRRALPLSALLLVAAVAVAVAACAGGDRGGASPGGASPGGASPGGSSAGLLTVSVEGGGIYTRVAPARLATMLSARDTLLVNVHVPYEGEIDGTDVFIPYDQVPNRLEELPADTSTQLVVYCRTGRMSAIAATSLVRLGYTSVLELEGGFDAWRSAGFPLVQRPRDGQ